MSLLSLHPSLLPFPPLLFLLFSPSKGMISLENLSPCQASVPLAALTHTRAHARANTWVCLYAPRHHLANEPWKLVPVNALILHDPLTVAARWHCVSSYFHTQKKEKRREWEALLLNWLGLQARSGNRSDPDAVKLSSRPRFSTERKEQRTGNDSKL